MGAPDTITSLKRTREVLDKTTSTHATLLKSLIDSGKNHPFSCKPAQRLVFGPKENDFPVLGKKQAPFDTNTLPSPKDMRRILVVDFWAARQQYGQHLHPAGERALSMDAEYENPDLELLRNLTNAGNNIDGNVLSFPSPSLDDLCGDAKVEFDNVLRESMTTATILPRDTLLPLQHSNEGTTFTTLLAGVLAWIIWPPTAHNLNILRNSYENLAEGFDNGTTDVTGELEDGVCLIQSVGEAIRIPPFCPMLCLSLEATTLATYSVVTIDQLAAMLGKLPLLLAWFKTEMDGERKKQDLVAAMIPHFEAILQGTYEATDLEKLKFPYVREGPLHSLLHSWDDIKYSVASVLAFPEAERVKAIWENFLRNAKGRECWICGKSISNKLRDMGKHFDTAHWPTNTVTKSPKQQRTPQNTPRSTPMKATAPPSTPSRIGNEASSNATETIGPQKGTPEKVIAPPSVLDKTGAEAVQDLMEFDKAQESPVYFC